MYETKTFQFLPENANFDRLMVATAVVNKHNHVNVVYAFPFTFEPVEAQKHKEHLDAIYKQIRDWCDEKEYVLWSY